MKNIVFFGFNETTILELINHTSCNLVEVVTQENRLSKTMVKLLDTLNIPLIYVKNKQELESISFKNINIDFILISYFGIIVPDSIVNKYQCFNIHTGDLTNNRGPYPLVWTILNDFEYATSTLYKLGKKIDTGLIVSKYEVKVNDDDDNISLAQKLDDGIKQHLDSLVNFDLNVQNEYITNGVYRHKVDESNITISDLDSKQIINKKIRSQVSYGGAILVHNGNKYRVSSLIEYFNEEEKSND